MPALKLHEALVHDRRAVGEVGAEADAVGVGDAHAGRDHVVGHARELVDAVDLERLAARRGSAAATAGSAPGSTGPGARPGDVGQHAEDAVEVGAVRARRAGARAGAGAGRRRAASAGGAARSSITVVTATTRTPRRTSSPTARQLRRASVAARRRQDAGADGVARRALGPSAIVGYQVSSTRSSSVSVASPTPQAPRVCGSPSSLIADTLPGRSASATPSSATPPRSARRGRPAPPSR